jgi:hypothetical protein
MHDADKDDLLAYNEFKSVWDDIVSWFPPCNDGEEMTPAGLSQIFAQMTTEDWPYTD